MVRAAVTAWPGVTLAAHVFRAHVESVLGPAAGVAQLEALRPHAAELYLARACAAGDPRALAILDERYIGGIAGHLRRFDDADLAEEALQQLRQRLLMATGDQPPRILQYAGGGSLLGWLKVAALRQAVDLQRRRRRAPDAGASGDLDELLDARDPELEYLKDRYREDFRAAVHGAVTALGAQERNILRLYAIDGLNIEQIGALFKVHRATVARWIAASRDRLRQETSRRLQATLQVTSTEVESLLRMLDSDLAASLHGVL